MRAPLRRLCPFVASLIFWAGCSSDSRPDSEPVDQGDPDVESDVESDAGPDAGDAADDGGDGGDGELRLPASWTVAVAAAAPGPVLQAAQDVADYLGRMGLTVELASDVTAPTCTAGVGLVALLGDGVGEAVFTSEETDQTWQILEARCDGDGFLVTLAGGGLLGRQYAAYELLHALGVRFFHPEQEYVPSAPRWPVEALSVEHTPAFRYRSVSLHLTHPLELGDIFREGDETYLDEARRYIDWQVKNLASFGTEGVGAGGLDRYGIERGFPTSEGFSLYGQQQGASGIIDPDDPRSVEEQIAAAIDERMGEDRDEWPDFFSFGFDPTEFTEIDDREAVDQMTFIADYITENYPGVQVQTTNHGSYGAPTDFYGVRYYSLPQFAPPTLGVKVHTLMFYDLFRPAPVYGNTDFHFHYDFMAQEYQTRQLWYFPESAWWLTFDIAVPLYLPLTIEARDRDIQAIAFMLEGRLDGHRVFGTGHEWGYWQNEYCSFRMAADLAYRYTDCLADLTSPMGEAASEVQAVLERVIALQERDIIYGDLLPYLVGTDTETEVALSVGIEFHPLPPAPVAILRWDVDAVTAWQRRVAPALKRMDDDYAALVARLEAVAPRVPDHGRPWFEEVLDGVEVTGLRARHAREVYGALVTLRESQLRFDEVLADAAEALLEAADETTEAALAVVARREAGYRYAPLARSIGGGPGGDEDENWTIYPYRYLNRTHNAFYWTRIDGLARAAFEGGGEVVEIADALLDDGEALELTVTDATLEDVSVDFGDGSSAEGPQQTHTYVTPGVYTLTLAATREGVPFERVGDVARLVEEYSTGHTATIVEPEAASLIEGVLPGLTFGPIDEGRVALGFDAAGDGRVGLGLWDALVPAEGEALFESRPARLIVPVVNRSTAAVLTSIVVEQGVLRLEDAASDAVLTGELSTAAVIDAIVAIGGGFDREGATRIVASTLGYTPDTLPELVAFEVAFEVGEGSE